MSFTARIDRADEKRMLKGYSDDAVQHILTDAAKEGGRAGAAVLKAAAPVGVSARLSQYYRRLGLPHGTFRRSVRAAPIRGRGSAISGLQARTVGVVVGPMGSKAFTRGWIEQGTTHSRANPWVERSAAAALSAAQRGSEAVLELYAREH